MSDATDDMVLMMSDDEAAAVANPADVLGAEAMAEMAAAIEAEEALGATEAAAVAPSPTRTISFTIVPDGRGYRGTLIVPLTDGRAVKAAASGPDKASALGRAASIAKSIEDNDVLKALLPPQAAVALKATTALAKAAKLGKLGEVAKRFKGPALKRLAKVFS